MIIAELINPQIFNNKEWYEQTLVLTDTDTGETVDRYTVSYKWVIDDTIVQAEICKRACDKYEELYGQTQEPQETLRWDWPQAEEYN